MGRGDKMRKDALRRYFIYRMKLIELFHFNLLWVALDKNKFVPENVMGHEGRDFSHSVRTASLSWFCTIVDQSNEGLNVFDLWRQLFPKHRTKIDRVWNEVKPHWRILREFRDKCGFHADTPRRYFAAKQKVLEKPQVAKAVQTFLDLAVFFIRKEPEELPDFVPEVEGFLLDFELEFRMRVNRDSFKRLLILPRENYKTVYGP